jgi:hypothetical protein
MLGHSLGCCNNEMKTEGGGKEMGWVGGGDVVSYGVTYCNWSDEEGVSSSRMENRKPE